MIETIKRLHPQDFRVIGTRRKFFNNLNENVITATLCVFIILTSFASIFYFNRFVTLYTEAITAKADVTAYLQKRGNVITNLTKMVSDYAEHEKSMYRYIADIRRNIISQRITPLEATKSIDRSNIESKNFAKSEGVISKFIALSESYPDLKLNENFRVFMKEMVLIETDIADARVIYNTKVNSYIAYRKMFPNSIFGQVFRFHSMDFFHGDVDFQKFKEVDY